MIARRRIVTSGEQDAHAKGWRRVYCYLQRAGTVKKIKRQTNRRERREGVQAVRDELNGMGRDHNGRRSSPDTEPWEVEPPE